MAELDSLKIEKLLKSATNERQRKMYQALLKKARSQEQQAAKTSSANKTQVKAQAVLGKVEKQSSGTTKKKKTTQKILQKESAIETVIAKSPQIEVDNEAKSLPKLETPPKLEAPPLLETPPKLETPLKLEAPPKLEKPPAKEQKSTLSSSKTDSKVATETSTNTSKSAAKNNQNSAKQKSSNNQKEAQEQKAKSTKQKQSNQKTQKRKFQRKPPIFQALGKMVLTPYIKGNNLKVELNGQEYDLLYGSDFTVVAHRKLRQDLTKNGSRKMLLKLYPHVQFSKKSFSAKLSFILGNFDKQYYSNRQYSHKFKLQGIWQYVPYSKTPVISIYRNMEQLGEFKQLNEKEQLKLAKPNHLPVVWNNAPVAPFKYVEGVPKEEQMPRYFVQVRAVLQDDMYVVEEILKKPTLDIPPHIKGDKLKEYDFKNIKGYYRQSNKSQTSTDKELTLSQLRQFQFVLRGKVLIQNDGDFFELENGTKFSFKEILVDSYTEEITDWQVVPVINSNGQIVSLILEKPLSEDELITTPSNLIIETGRIIEVGRKDDRFKIRVDRHKAKTLKIVAHSGEFPMKVGQVWSIKLVLKEDHLYVQEAEYLKD